MKEIPSAFTSYTKERRLLEPVPLCKTDGKLNPDAVGWATSPLIQCNLKGDWLRKKKWNYWAITSPDALFSLTLSNVDYMGLAFIYFLDFHTLEFTEQTVMAPFGAGCLLGETVDEPVHFEHKKMQLTMQPGGDQIYLKAASPAFGGKKLSAEFLVTNPKGHETLNVVIPWSEDRFQFTSKQNSLPAEGKVYLGERVVDFPRGASYACLDFGRGKWKYKSFWNWAGGSGKQGGHLVGLNFGGGWTDQTGMTENALTVDGKILKIGDDLEFKYDSTHFIQPWTIRTKSSDLVDLTFTPFYERIAKSNVWVIRSEVHQMIGRFSGSLNLGEGKTLPISDLIGWAEDHHALW